MLRAGARLGIPFSLGVFIMIGANDELQTASAEGDTRTLSFHHAHTGENITVTFKRNGRYDDAALKKLDWFMRDWRKEESVRMDPHLFDLLWETYREVGGKRPIEVICGYRAAGTNAMLRARSTGVAKNSNHVGGMAIDFAIPGVDLEKLREVGLRLQRGGVGFYPTSGSPFVHMDTGTVRHWPRMTRDQLVKVFPDQRTVHVPSDGQPLAGYALALADVEARGNEPNAVSLTAARDAGIVTADAGKPKRSFLATLFGSGKQDADETEDQQPRQTAAAKRTRAPVILASAAPKPVAVERVVPLPAARPAALAQAAPRTQILAAAMFENRSFVVSKVESSDLTALIADAPALTEQPPFALASADPMTTASAAPLAYAAATPLPKPAMRAQPMGAAMASLPATAVSITTTAFTVPFTPALSGGVQSPGSPWLRAAMLTPSVSGFLTATNMKPRPMRPLVGLLYKPAVSLVMTFSADPHMGMTASRFDGHAVVFLATATFAVQTTAALR
jgi:uncharacterized protein YcbK (DUF882 family)